MLSALSKEEPKSIGGDSQMSQQQNNEILIHYSPNIEEAEKQRLIERFRYYFKRYWC